MHITISPKKNMKTSKNYQTISYFQLKSYQQIIYTNFAEKNSLLQGHPIWFCMVYKLTHSSFIILKHSTEIWMFYCWWNLSNKNTSKFAVENSSINHVFLKSVWNIGRTAINFHKHIVNVFKSFVLCLTLQGLWPTGVLTLLTSSLKRYA